jgi:hypothetical protein
MQCLPGQDWLSRNIDFTLPRSSIKEKLTHLLSQLLREVDLSLRNARRRLPVQLARSLRLIHTCSVEVWVIHWFSVFAIFPLRHLWPTSYFDWPLRSRKSSQHTWRGLILYEASILPWRPRRSIKEQLAHFLIVVVCKVDLSCQTYGDDYRSSSPALSISFTHAVLRYGFSNGFSVFTRYLPFMKIWLHPSFSFHFRCRFLCAFIMITRSEVCKS